MVAWVCGISKIPGVLFSKQMYDSGAVSRSRALSSESQPSLCSKQNMSFRTAMSQTSQRFLQYAMFYNDIAVKMSYASLRRKFRWLRTDFCCNPSKKIMRGAQRPSLYLDVIRIGKHLTERLKIICAYHKHLSSKLLYFCNVFYFEKTK